MASLTENERKALLILFKDFTSYHNANTLSKKLGISRIGTMKMLKKLKAEDILIDKEISKSTIYRPNFEEDYVKKLISFLLTDEANKFRRWKYEFKDIFKKDRIVLIYGSAIRNYEKAKDIDVMIVLDKKDIKEVNSILNKAQEFLPKKIHPIKLTEKEISENLLSRQEAIVDIVKNAIVLYGQEKYVEVIKNVTSI